MNDNIAICISGFMSILCWWSGHLFTRHTRELYLPKWVKVLYGKPNQPVYENGALSQTVGYILGLYTLQLGMYSLGYDPIFTPRFVLTILASILGLAVIINTTIDAFFK